MTDDLEAFLTARLDEDELEAIDLDHSGWTAEAGVVTADSLTSGRVRRLIIDLSGKDLLADHIARHDPARALRQVAINRRLMLWEPNRPLLALLYDDHPDYRAEWAPAE